MPRKARIVIPDTPHHVVQRGNRRQRTFFCEQDYRFYLNTLKKWCDNRKVALWAYCLMPNHVHLVLVPSDPDGLAFAVGETHKTYSRRINKRQEWQGHLWQHRFSSFAMDERYLLAASRYIELNPVRAGLSFQAEDYEWSSAYAHCNGTRGRMSDNAPLPALVGNWRHFLDEGLPEKEAETLRLHSNNGLPVGSENFITKLESETGLQLRKKQMGRPKSGDSYHLK